ncbi:MAG TPA: DUF1697 domain-containing protein [Thermoleophilaceae bacterium]|jgi:uncharacterized protein (DUF1697 family)|nr:DUF1697 domain-containing protein [Thermoleophilaceae bacterium]
MTPTHAAFLRGVNLGSTRKTGSAELRACFEALGFGDVATFRTSGNVVFGANRAPTAKRIEDAMHESFGFEVKVFLRTAAQVRKIAKHDPFPRARSEGKLQVALLSRKPSPAKQKQVLAHATEADRLAFGASELYWLPSGRMRDAGLDLRAVEQLTDAWTMRTMATLELVASKFFGA